MLRQHGFILVTTIWFLAVLAIAVGFFAIWVDRALEKTQNSLLNAQAQQELNDTRATILYLLAVQPFTFGGLSVIPATAVEEITDLLLMPRGDEIAFDDRVYQGMGNAFFALQDESGLLDISILAYNEHVSLLERTARLLAILGVPVEAQQPLVTKLLDYTDRDDNHRINGAEAYHYRELNLPPPTNQQLKTPQECYNILDWSRYDGLWTQYQWQQLTTVASTGILNLNTAPLEILQLIPEFDQETAKNLIALRQPVPFTSVTALENALGIALTTPNLDFFERGFSLFATKYLRVSLWHRDTHTLQQIHLTLTPIASKAAPWQIQYAIELPILDKYATAASYTPQSPLFPSALPANP